MTVSKDDHIKPETTLEGLAKHNGPVREPNWALAEANGAFDLELGSWPSLEAQVAAIADDIAYDNHDIDDGLRAGIIALDELVDTDTELVEHRWRVVNQDGRMVLRMNVEVVCRRAS
mgnify:CR=1 FL=1